MLNLLQSLSDLLFRTAERIDLYVHAQRFPADRIVDLAPFPEPEPAAPCLAHASDFCDRCHNHDAADFTPRHPPFPFGAACIKHAPKHLYLPCTPSCSFDDDLPF